MEIDLATIFIFFLVSGGALFVFLLFGRFIRPRHLTPIKTTTYECGEKPFGPAWFNFNNRFYLIALVFVVLDVEAVLTVPAIVVFRKLVASGRGELAMLEIFAFLLVFFGVLVYVWRRGDLNWVRSIEPPVCAPFDFGGKEEKP
jgi:NADH-quinone oxidoreductase subunit A